MTAAEYKQAMKTGMWPWMVDGGKAQPRRAPDGKKEEDHQRDVFRWADQAAPLMPELHLLFHVPNGGARKRVEAAILVGMGVKKGYPDIALDVARGGYHGLRIEMKVHPNRPTAEQRAWLARLDGEGFKTAVCYSADEAIGEILEYLNLDNQPVSRARGK